MKLLYDDIIFRLQKVGGISNVFSHFISFAKIDKSIDLSYVSTTKHSINNFYWSKLNIPKPKVIKNISINILQFVPFIKLDVESPTIYHATYYNFPLKKQNIIYLITIHDLGYERGIMQKGLRRYINIFFKRLAIINADGIICVSKCTFDDLLFYYGKHLKNKQITVIHNGISNNFKNLGFKSSISSKNVIFVGGRQKYKNFEDLVKAISYSEEFNLVILGGGDLSEYHLNFMKNIIPNRFAIYKDISEQKLNYFYNNSFCLVYPSSYEGFGLPILESMAAGCPVITCSNSSIVEISGGNAILIPNSNPENIFNSLIQLKDFEFRTNLILKGIEHSKNFNWNITFKKTKEFYMKMINLKQNKNI
jgi:glycosyltransferase involved in cell wall biosynthesis